MSSSKPSQWYESLSPTAKDELKSHRISCDEVTPGVAALVKSLVKKNEEGATAKEEASKLQQQIESLRAEKEKQLEPTSSASSSTLGQNDPAKASAPTSNNAAKRIKSLLSIDGLQGAMKRHKINENIAHPNFLVMRLVGAIEDLEEKIEGLERTAAEKESPRAQLEALGRLVGIREAVCLSEVSDGITYSLLVGTKIEFFSFSLTLGIIYNARNALRALKYQRLGNSYIHPMEITGWMVRNKYLNPNRNEHQGYAEFIEAMFDDDFTLFNQAIVEARCRRKIALKKPSNKEFHKYLPCVYDNEAIINCRVLSQLPQGGQVSWSVTEALLNSMQRHVQDIKVGDSFHVRPKPTARLEELRHLMDANDVPKSHHIDENNDQFYEDPPEAFQNLQFPSYKDLVKERNARQADVRSTPAREQGRSGGHKGSSTQSGDGERAFTGSSRKRQADDHDEYHNAAFAARSHGGSGYHTENREYVESTTTNPSTKRRCMHENSKTPQVASPPPSYWIQHTEGPKTLLQRSWFSPSPKKGQP